MIGLAFLERPAVALTRASIDETFQAAVPITRSSQVIPYYDSSILIFPLAGLGPLNRLTDQGALDQNFRALVVKTGLTTCREVEVTIEIRILVMGTVTSPSGNSSATVLRLLPTGARDDTFDPELEGFEPVEFRSGIDGALYVLTTNGWIVHLDSTGKRVAAFDPAGEIGGLAGVDDSGRLIAYLLSPGDTTRTVYRDLFRFHPDGSRDTGYVVRLINNDMYQVVGDTYSGTMSVYGMLGGTRTFFRLNGQGLPDPNYAPPERTTFPDFLTWRGLYRRDGTIWEIRRLEMGTRVTLYSPSAALTVDGEGNDLDFENLVPVAVAWNGTAYAFLTQPSLPQDTRLVRISFSDAFPAYIGNFSVLSEVAGGYTATLGFVTTAPGRILARAVGPGLLSFDIEDFAPDPQLDIYDSRSERVGQNNNWAPSMLPEMVAAGAFGLSMGSFDSVIDIGVNQSTSYTAVGFDLSGATSSMLLEVYDLPSVFSTVGAIRNASALVRVREEKPAIMGITLSGEYASDFLIRAAGPSLAPFNVPNALSDPRIALYRGATLVSSNDDWGADSTQQTRLRGAEVLVGAFRYQLPSRDAGLLVSLKPGAYTVVVRGAPGEDGNVLIETYALPRPLP